MVIQRINTQGHKYQLMGLEGQDETRITGHRKTIIVKHDIQKLKKSWFEWTQNGLYVQNAFPYLTVDEREFLITGITKDE